jgi:DNA-binding NarL/FixJ family response regulator
MKILIVDDHSIILKGLTVLLNELFIGVKVFEAHLVSEAKIEFSKNTFDMIIMDLSLPDSDGMKLLDYFVEHDPNCKILVFSMNNEDVYAQKVIKAGAKGYVSKANGYDVLRNAILKVSKNGLYVSDYILEKILLDKSLRSTDGKSIQSNPLSNLTSRELEIVRLVYMGKGTKDIATMIGLKANTVSTFKARIYDKLAVNNLHELIELVKLYGVN